MTFNYTDVFERVSQSVSPDTPAVICDGTTTNWSKFNAQSLTLASAFVGHGMNPDARVALYIHNGVDYLTAFAACFHARLVPGNINDLHSASEIDYLLDNSDSEAAVFDAEFNDILESTTAARKRPRNRRWCSFN